VRAGQPDRSGAIELDVGTEAGGAHAGRAYLHFNLASSQTLANKYVSGAALTMYDVWAASSTPTPVTVFEVAGPWVGTTRWPGAPVNRAYETRSFAHRAGASGAGGPAWGALQLDATGAARGG